MASVTLPKDVFAVEVTNHELLKQAYDTYLANNRTSAASTLERGEVRGGGKKPWKQKGTGRARAGSIRSPLWRGGGVTFGPTGNENYTKKLPKTSKHVALRQALTLANQAKRVKVVELTTTGKTVEVAKFLTDNKFERRTLIVVAEKTSELIRATANIQSVKLVSAKYLNVFDILNADHIAIAPGAVEVIAEWIGTKEAK